MENYGISAIDSLTAFLYETFGTSPNNRDFAAVIIQERILHTLEVQQDLHRLFYSEN